jgi:hypothetical protein
MKEEGINRDGQDRQDKSKAKESRLEISNPKSKMSLSCSSCPSLLISFLASIA